MLWWGLNDLDDLQQHCKVLQNHINRCSVLSSRLELWYSKRKPLIYNATRQHSHSGHDQRNTRFLRLASYLVTYWQLTLTKGNLPIAALFYVFVWCQSSQSTFTSEIGNGCAG
ncbi:hypothetical protein GALMADRAFT_1217073 [Galerina marginata CBS 339.88]|uniref:Uncharacterized protein n=1 Tax=Galerina marginata (strain CBS 339.88) TaxID=685588 RepID=A0A067S4W7_GALM3|nr:hypothetical protein GALMADRAFT_1217073 [Galerina marginata CBS 339.88]